jgi:hypothetical protein
LADLADLKSFGEQASAVLTDLFARASKDGDKSDPGPAVAAVATHRKLVGESTQPTEAPLEARTAAIVGARTVLTQTLLGAASSRVQLKETDVREIQALRTSLRNAFGLLLEMEAFAPIARLLDDGQIQTISADLDRAEREIKQRRRAKQVLDSVVQVVITAAGIAAKVAA